jgi:hypothetical protein
VLRPSGTDVARPLRPEDGLADSRRTELDSSVWLAGRAD